MRVLVTNDDGVHARGIEVLAECAREVFDEVIICAPATEQSGVAQKISLHAPLRMETHAPVDGVERYSVDGTPVDSVFVALAHILKDRRPDLVISGINHGPNVGYDIYYSGTVGAAREALIHGIPALAFSLSARPPQPFDAVRPIVLELLRRVREFGVPPEVLLNINIPGPRVGPDGAPLAAPVGEAAASETPSWLGVPGIRGVRTTTLGRRFYTNEVVFREDPRGRPYFWIGGAWPRIEHTEGTDCESVRQGWVSVTPLGLDATEHGALGALAPHFHTP